MVPEEGIDTTAQSVVTEGSATTETSQTTEQTQAPPVGADTGQTPEARQAAEEKRIRWRDEFFKAREREERLLRLLEARGAEPAKPQPAMQPGQKGDWRSEGRPPREDDFPGNYEAYLDAKADWKIDQRLAAESRQRQERARQWQQSERQQAFQAKIQKGVEKYPDFESVAMSDDVPITDDMAQAMFDSDHFTEIAYHLGKNPKEAARIASLSPWAAAREIGKIEDKIAQSPGKGATAAPGPVKTVSGNSPGTQKSDDDIPIDEWMKRENERDLKRRFPFMGRR